VESYVSVLCYWLVVFKHSLNLQNLVSITKYILTPLVYHTKTSRLFTLLSSLRNSKLAFFWFFRNWNQQIKVSGHCSAL
jgi:hypothetical protein